MIFALCIVSLLQRAVRSFSGAPANFRQENSFCVCQYILPYAGYFNLLHC